MRLLFFFSRKAEYSLTQEKVIFIPNFKFSTPPGPGEVRGLKQELFCAKTKCHQEQMRIKTERPLILHFFQPPPTQHHREVLISPRASFRDRHALSCLSYYWKEKGTRCVLRKSRRGTASLLSLLRPQRAGSPSPLLILTLKTSPIQE